VSIVGTREVTEDGRLRTRRLARELAQAGVVVVSPAPDANQPEKRKRFTLSIFDGPNGTPLDAVEASRVYRRIVSAGGRD
jgi:hypothetical protein